MILKDLFQKSHFRSVWLALENNYPDSHEPSYRAAWEEINSLTPITSEDSKGMVVGIQIITPEDDEWTEEEYVTVSGQKLHSEYGDQFIWGLDLTPWREWLSLEVDQETLEEFGETLTLTHILWEMTFHGYSQDSTQETRDRITEISDEVKKASDEGRLDEITEPVDLDKLREDE